MRILDNVGHSQAFAWQHDSKLVAVSGKSLEAAVFVILQRHPFWTIRPYTLSLLYASPQSTVSTNFVPRQKYALHNVSESERDTPKRRWPHLERYRLRAVRKDPHRCSRQDRHLDLGVVRALQLGELEASIWLEHLAFVILDGKLHVGVCT